MLFFLNREGLPPERQDEMNIITRKLSVSIIYSNLQLPEFTKIITQSQPK